jgi:hypothetical protein
MTEMKILRLVSGYSLGVYDYERDIEIRAELNIYYWNDITTDYKQRVESVMNTRCTHSQVSASTSPEKKT